MSGKEAAARIKINDLLKKAGWKFFPDDSKPANIRLEVSTSIKKKDLDALGDNFEKTAKGYIDFLLLDSKGFPLLVLEIITGMEKKNHATFARGWDEDGKVAVHNFPL